MSNNKRKAERRVEQQAVLDLELAKRIAEADRIAIWNAIGKIYKSVEVDLYWKLKAHK